MNSANTLDQLLSHVIEVELEMVNLSAESHKKITQWISDSKLIPSGELIEAMQYQDILAQQLSATCDALSSLREHLGEILTHSTGEPSATVEMIDTKISRILEEAKFKRSAFTGKKVLDDNDGIEFF